MGRIDHIMSGDDYVAFLVERRDGRLRWLALDIVGNPVWVNEADDAIHFARRSDAERMVDDVPDDWDIHIVDHCWPGGTPRDRVVQWVAEGDN